MGDTIFLRGLEARGIIGIHDWEREQKQTIRIDLDMACDGARAAEADEIGHTVDYRAVAKAVLAHVEGSAYQLIETLAERLAAMIREEHGVSWVRVRVAKPGAIRFSETVGIEIERGRREAGEA